MRILIVEDDEKTASYLKRGLSEAGHVVDRASDGATGLAMALEDIYDVLVLDRMLPQMDGIELVKGLRARGNQVPALMLSARASTQDRIEGLQAGCDDYIAKPYAFSEILARLDALARRVQPTRRQAVLKVGDLELDLLGRRAVRGARHIDLQYREFLLLELLMRHAGQIVTRSMLLETAWPYDFEPRGNIIDMHIHRLRGKVDEGFATPLIHTVQGSGYVLSPQRP
jgi:two-component system, OmpR family, response regulator